VSQGCQTHTYPTGKVQYGTYNRIHATTNVSWQTSGIQKSDRDVIWEFWNDILKKGYNDVTIIDHRNRMLFDASWFPWHETWKKERGGLFTIDYNFSAPCSWTPSCWGCWPSTTEDLTNHNLSGDDLTLNGASMINHSSDNNVLRKTGYAIFVSSGNEGSASNIQTLNWDATGDFDSSLTLFCQVRIPVISETLPFYNTKKVHAINITESEEIFSTENFVAIEFQRLSGALTDLHGKIKYSGTEISITKAAGTVPSLPVNTWYDIAITYNCVTNYVSVYYATSALNTFTDFLTGLESIEDGIISTRSDNNIVPAACVWKGCNIAHVLVEDSLSSNLYIQNVFILHGFITPLEFNTLRRLCYMWNNKTTGSWPA